MTTYTISETNNINSERSGSDHDLTSLTAAKRFATRNQCFYGTVLKIEVNGTLVSYKDGKKWTDCTAA